MKKIRQTLFIVSVKHREYGTRVRFAIVANANQHTDLKEILNEDFDMEDWDMRTLKVEHEVTFTEKVSMELEV